MKFMGSDDELCLHPWQEINHAGAGGLWAELVRNRGFEEGGSTVPSNIYPWTMVGDESTIEISTDRSSCFDRNKVALRMNVLCHSSHAVGISNPGFWGMVGVFSSHYLFFFLF